MEAVVSAERGTATEWQAELLAYSFARLSDPTHLTVLMAGGGGEHLQRADPNLTVFSHPVYRLSDLPGWTPPATVGEGPYQAPAREYPPYNRLFGLRDWLQSDGPSGQDVLVLDPDMVLLQRLPGWAVAAGKPMCQAFEWMDQVVAGPAKQVTDNPQLVLPFGVPMLFSSQDLRCMVPKACLLTQELRTQPLPYPWVAEMAGVVAATAQCGETANLVDIDCTVILHYFGEHCTSRYGWKADEQPWRSLKNGYRPWERVDAPAGANAITEQLAAIVNEYAEVRVGGG